MPGDHLDLTSGPEHSDHALREQILAGRRYVGIHFACCVLYSRVDVNRDETAYVGHCPRCSRRITLKIGPGGTESRFFTAY
jgi:hypothetical protein